MYVVYVTYADIDFWIQLSSPYKPAILVAVEATTFSTITWLVDSIYKSHITEYCTAFTVPREQTLQTVAFCGSSVHNSLSSHFCVAINQFRHAIVTRMWPIHHVPYTALASNWLTDTTWVPSWFAFHSRSPEKLFLRSQQNHYGQTEAVSRTQHHHS